MWLIIQILLSASIVWLKASHALLWKHFRFTLQLRTVSKRNQPKSWYEYAGTFKAEHIIHLNELTCKRVIRVVYRTPGFSVSKRILRTRHVRVFFYGHLPLPMCVGRSKANDRCRRVLEYSLTGRHSTLSENEAFPWYALRLYLKISLHFFSGLLVRQVNF